MENLKKLQALLTDGTDALLLTGRVSRLYAAGYDIAEGVAVIGRKQSFYFTDSRYIEAAEKGLPDFTVLETDRQNTYPDRINGALETLGAQTLGVEEDSLTHGEFLRYEEKLNARLIPCGKAISEPRQIKEPWEVEVMRRAQKIADRTFAELLGVIREGITEKELAAELICRLYRGGADGLSFQPIVVSGPNTSLPHGVPTDRKLQYGDFITMDFGCMVDGYCSDMTRTVALGFVSGEMRQVYETVLQAQRAGIQATRAGVTGRDIDAAARTVIEKAGYGAYFGHGYGHGLGLEVHEGPNCSPANHQPIPAGAVCSAEPGIYLPGKFGVRIEDVVVVTAEGCQNITESPKELVII